jgi:hypothetical protein
LDNLEPIIINHLKSLGFHYGKEPASSEIITQDLQLQLHRLFEKYPKRYPKTEGTRGIFTAILRVPDTPDSSYAIRVNLHPILDIGRAKTEHILAADEISVTLISIKDQETARHVLDSVQIALEKNRFTEREIEAQHNDKKIIPAGWIELDDIKILPSSQHKTFIIQLVRQRQKEGEGKIPIIRFSSGTEKNRPEQAEIILSAAKEFIATALEADKPISISSIKDGLQKQGFITSRTYERGDTLQARDIRTIYCENKPILQLFTAYNTEQGDGTYITNFRITPTNGSSYTPLTKIIPTGTANPTVAGTRRKILYDFVEGVLALYFQQNPDQEILTEMRSARGKMVNAIKLQHDVEATAEDRHHFIDGNGLKEVIGQLLEHARDHFWSITYAPIDVTMPEGRQKITAQCLHNFDEPMPSDMAPYDKPLTLFAESAAGAKAFKETVISSLLGTQNRSSNEEPNLNVSVERPVNFYGAPSSLMVIRHSLMAGFALTGIDLPGDTPDRLKELREKVLQKQRDI